MMIGVMLSLMLGLPDGLVVAGRFDPKPGAKAAIVKEKAYAATSEGTFESLERATLRDDAVAVDAMVSSRAVVPVDQGTSVTVVRQVTRPGRGGVTDSDTFQQEVQAAAARASFNPIEVRFDDGEQKGKTAFIRLESLGILVRPSPTYGKLDAGDRAVVIADVPLAYAKSDSARVGFIAFAQGKSPQGLKLAPGTRLVVLDYNNDVMQAKVSSGSKGAGKVVFIHRTALAPASAFPADKNGRTQLDAAKASLWFGANMDQCGWHSAAREQYRRTIAGFPNTPEAKDAESRMAVR